MADVAYDITAVRARFPALRAGIAHFDGPGGTQTPQPVIDAIGEALRQPLSNLGNGTTGERNAAALVQGGRRAMADLLGADPAGIVFGRSATQLTYDFSRTLAKSWSPGDEVVVSRLDHDANIRPWVQAAAGAGAVLRWIDFDPATGELTTEHVLDVLSERTRLVALTAASNLIGTRPDIVAISPLVHDRGALLYVDGVHYTAHCLADVEEMGADVFVCSPYKFLGPHMGVAAGRVDVLERLAPDKLLPSSNAVPERFEFGTLPYEMLAGARAAVDFLAGLSGGEAAGRTRRDRLIAALGAVHAYEHELLHRLEAELAGFRQITRHARAVSRTPTVLLSIEGRSTADAARFLAERGVAAGAGSFYAPEASRRLGLGDRGGLRAGLALYTNTEDVDRLLTGLADFLRRPAAG